MCWFGEWEHGRDDLLDIHGIGHGHACCERIGVFVSPSDDRRCVRPRVPGPFPH